MPDLTGKVALVTGASSGIGASVAKELARCGAAVAINYYPGNEGDAQAVVAEIESAGGRAVAVAADVTDSEQTVAMIDSAIESLGALDIVVNNAGITRDGLLVRMSDADWGAVISTNLTGVFNTTRAAAKHMMKARSGAIVNVASVIGLVGNAGQANYAAAKAGVIGLTKSVARELAGRNVRANAVAPGFIETAMTATLPEAVREASQEAIALKRFGQPEDVARAVAFLASDDAGYITGQTIAVDGGMTFV
ncbi:MAG: 3-oxoacyl-[acyl-carrier-protein] reductase [Coriobacteriales bacterium]|nr:3-oxoacyl-[acyl-carrier-protein] reductase [Coriobacteriales bacterium]